VRTVPLWRGQGEVRMRELLAKGTTKQSSENKCPEPATFCLPVETQFLGACTDVLSILRSFFAYAGVFCAGNPVSSSMHVCFTQETQFLRTCRRVLYRKRSFLRDAMMFAPGNAVSSSPPRFLTWGTWFCVCNAGESEVWKLQTSSPPSGNEGEATRARTNVCV